MIAKQRAGRTKNEDRNKVERYTRSRTNYYKEILHGALTRDAVLFQHDQHRTDYAHIETQTRTPKGTTDIKPEAASEYLQSEQTLIAFRLAGGSAWELQAEPQQKINRTPSLVQQLQQKIPPSSLNSKNKPERNRRRKRLACIP